MKNYLNINNNEEVSEIQSNTYSNLNLNYNSLSTNNNINHSNSYNDINNNENIENLENLDNIGGIENNENIDTTNINIESEIETDLKKLAKTFNAKNNNKNLYTNKKEKKKKVNLIENYLIKLKNWGYPEMGKIYLSPDIHEQEKTAVQTIHDRLLRRLHGHHLSGRDRTDGFCLDRGGHHHGRHDAHQYPLLPDPVRYGRQGAAGL